MRPVPWSRARLVVFAAIATIQGYRLTSNEWDVFPIEHLTLQGAIFATTLRYGMTHTIESTFEIVLPQCKSPAAMLCLIGLKIFG